MVVITFGGGRRYVQFVLTCFPRFLAVFKVWEIPARYGCRWLANATAQDTCRYGFGPEARNNRRDACATQDKISALARPAGLRWHPAPGRFKLFFIFTCVEFSQGGGTSAVLPLQIILKFYLEVSYLLAMSWV